MLGVVIFCCSIVAVHAQTVLVVGIERGQFKAKNGKKLVAKNKPGKKGMSGLIRETIVDVLVTSPSQPVFYYKTAQNDTITPYFWRNNKYAYKTLPKKKKREKTKKYAGLVLNEPTKNAIKAYANQYQVDYVVFLNRYHLTIQESTYTNYIPGPYSSGGGFSSGSSLADVHNIDYEAYDKSGKLVAFGQEGFIPKFTKKITKMKSDYERMGKQIGKAIQEGGGMID